jgi:hypothetical protein
VDGPMMHIRRRRNRHALIVAGVTVVAVILVIGTMHENHIKPWGCSLVGFILLVVGACVAAGAREGMLDD